VGDRENAPLGGFDPYSSSKAYAELAELVAAAYRNSFFHLADYAEHGVAIATLLLTVQEQQVVAAGKRRWVDPHWQGGNSYFRIGWNWLKSVLQQGWKLFATISLSGKAEPEPASASKKQPEKRLKREFTVNSYCFVQ
jgi:hypothetical protein